MAFPAAAGGASGARASCERYSVRRRSGSPYPLPFHSLDDPDSLIVGCEPPRHTSFASLLENKEIDGGQGGIEPPTRGFSVQD
jgi:hypothetical protein